MLRALLATALLFSLSTAATAQCPGPYCKMRRSNEAVPGGVGGTFGTNGGYVAAPPNGGYALPSGGYPGVAPGGGYGGVPLGGGYAGGPPGYGVVPPGGGYSGGGYGSALPGGGYGGSPPGGWNNNGIAYQNPPNPPISNYCVTPYGNCPAVQQVGTGCNCMDAAGNFYNGVAEQ